MNPKKEKKNDINFFLSKSTKNITKLIIFFVSLRKISIGCLSNYFYWLFIQQFSLVVTRISVTCFSNFCLLLYSLKGKKNISRNILKLIMAFD